MKLKFTYTILCLTFLAFVFSSNSGGRAGAANQGNSGAPGDDSKTCVTCHGNNAAIQVTLSMDVLDDNGNSIVMAGYVPGLTYEVQTTINVESGSPEGFGYQMTGINASMGQNGPMADAFSDPADNVQVATVSSTGRTYAEHKGVSASNVFSVRWTAPEANSGDVSFYACGNGVNGNNETGGDNAACNTLLLPENTSLSTNTLDENITLDIVPNPVEDVINLQTISPNTGDYELILTDIAGRQVYSESFLMPQGKGNSPIFVDQLQAGLYFLHLSGNGKIVTRQIVKK